MCIISCIDGYPRGDDHDGGIHPCSSQANTSVADGMVSLNYEEHENIDGRDSSEEHDPGATHAGAIRYVGEEKCCYKGYSIDRNGHQLRFD